MVSVIIPAHDEASGIRACLEALLKDVRPDEFEVIVVCNGCSDTTADEARHFSPRVTVIETPIASKRLAMDLGDRAATRYPRCYLDGDVQLGATDLRRLRDAVATGPLVAVPRLQFDLQGRPWVVRAFFRLWMRTAFFSEGMASSGAYLLSEEGRRRFGTFPDVIADDHYVLSLFSKHERCQVLDSVSIAQAPWSAVDIVRIKTRAFLAQRQLQQQPGLEIRQHGGRSDWLLIALRDPRLWAATPVYLALNTIADVRARVRFHRGDFRWERARSTRSEHTNVR